MTIGDTIWADAVLESGILRYMRTIDDANRLRPLALLVIRKINESHGIPESRGCGPRGEGGTSA